MYQRGLLKNGIRIVTEEIPYVNSVSIGIWVKVGSRQENKENNGMSHFIEHMLFKGTKNRSAKEIANAIDNIGGQLNAFTSKECTCFYAKVLDTHFDIAIDVLADMFFNSNFSEEDIEKEKGVIHEEINMYEDSPEELVHDIFNQIVWSKNSLGMPVLGSEKTLKSMTREKILQYMEDNYTPENIVISVVGNFDQIEIEKKIESYFEGLASKENKNSTIIAPKFAVKHSLKNKKIEQVHLCLGFDGVENKHQLFYPLLIVNNVLGGAMSSRLFQKIREDRGLAYSVYSYLSAYQDCGLITIYAGMKPSQLANVSELIMEELQLIKKEGVTPMELYNSKEQLKGSYILGLESTSGRMISIGKSELLLNRIYTPTEIIKKIDDINEDTVQQTIEMLFKLDKIGSAVIGNIPKDTDIKSMFTAK